MCEPVSAAIYGLATTAASYSAASNAAKTQAKAQRLATRDEQDRSETAQSSMRLRQGQENIALSQRKDATNLRSMEAKSRAKLVAISEAGVAGQSLTRLLGDFEGKEARYRFSEEQQKRFRTQQAGMALRDEQMRTTMNFRRINQPIEQPSLLISGLQGAQAGMSMYQAATPTPPTV